MGNIKKAVKCLSGWKDLYQPVIDAVVEYDTKQTEIGKKIGIKEINEVDGEMEISFCHPNNITDRINQLRNTAETQSGRVCEYCGSKEEIGMTMNYFYKTCCHTCWSDNVLPRYPKSVWKCLSNNQLYKKDKKN